jgi:hypothetical protein
LIPVICRGARERASVALSAYLVRQTDSMCYNLSTG